MGGYVYIFLSRIPSCRPPLVSRLTWFFHQAGPAYHVWHPEELMGWWLEDVSLKETGWYILEF